MFHCLIALQEISREQSLHTHTHILKVYIYRTKTISTKNGHSQVDTRITGAYISNIDSQRKDGISSFFGSYSFSALVEFRGGVEG